MRRSALEPTRLHVKRQRGASLLIFVVGLLLVAATVWAIKLLIPAARAATQAKATAANFEAIQSAILAYVAVNGHLPCPADPAPANDGQSAPPPPSAHCTTPNGVVPWATLGIAPEVALDGWNRRISFRVLDGAIGLTQAGGASMVNCDTVYPYGGSLPALPANGLCPPIGHPNTEAQFLNGKGLVVDDSGTLVSDVAYVLISHGESGYGAYLPGGQRMPMPPAGDELANANAASPLYKQAHSAPGIDPSSAAHFDDIVAWVTISDLAKKSGRGGRDWQDSGATVQISPATTANMSTPGAGHLNAAGSVPVTAVDTIPDAGGIDTLVVGVGGAGAGAACIWWPTSFTLYNSTTSAKFALRLYLEFSTTNAATDFGGFTVGFLSKSATDAAGIPFVGLCGDTTTSGSLGWGNGALAGNLPTPRFAVELDTFRDAINNDPPSNHLGIDFNGVVHGISATTCALSSDAYHTTGAVNDCYTGPSNAWLRDGLSNFHRMRVEVLPRDPACSAGTAARMKVWVMPQSICPNDSADAICASAKNLLQSFTPMTPLPAGAVAIESCIPLPVNSTAFDQLYFGFTASSLAGASGALLNIRNLAAAAFLAL